MKFQTLLYRPSPKKTSKCTGWCPQGFDLFLEVLYCWNTSSNWLILLQPSSCCSRSHRLPPDHQRPHTSCFPLQQGLCQGCQVGLSEDFYMFHVLVLIFSGMLKFDLLAGSVAMCEQRCWEEWMSWLTLLRWAQFWNHRFSIILGDLLILHF